MKNRTTIALAAAALLASVGVASAATMAPQTSDTLSLSNTQQKTAWNDLNTHATNQTAPSGFMAQNGAVVPSAIRVSTVPSRAARDVPSLRHYDLAKVQGKLLIVNPSDHRVADIING